MLKPLLVSTAIALVLALGAPMSVDVAHAKSDKAAQGIGRDGTPPGKTDDPRGNAPGQAKKSGGDDGGDNGGGDNGGDDDAFDGE